MAKIAQFRYYGENNPDNYTSRHNNSEKPTKENLMSGSIFNDYYTIVQLGIQCLPGTKFFINNCDYPMIIGATGIFDLELDTSVKIQNLTFSAESLDRVNQTSGTQLLIDILYEGSAS